MTRFTIKILRLFCLIRQGRDDNTRLTQFINFALMKYLINYKYIIENPNKKPPSHSYSFLENYTFYHTFLLFGTLGF